MQRTLKKLKLFAHNCWEDMHEPDEQSISAIVSGFHLDNAMGDDPRINCGEFTIGLSNDGGISFMWFNLATLIALARKAKL